MSDDGGGPHAPRTGVRAGAFEFVDGPTGDLSFVARAPTLEGLFAAAAEAFLAVTLEDPSALETRERHELALEEPDLELLLLRFVNELVFLRDASELLLRPQRVHVTQDGVARLAATLAGERIDRGRHALRSDVKAATAHALRVAETAGGWEARLTLDV
jgi:SHS2 domain-containing protein